MSIEIYYFSFGVVAGALFTRWVLCIVSDAENEIVRLRAELAEATKAMEFNFEQYQDAARLLNDECEKVEALTKQRDALQQALIKYGQHKLSCDYVENHEGGIFGSSTGKCDCGFADVIDAIKGGAA